MYTSAWGAQLNTHSQSTFAKRRSFTLFSGPICLSHPRVSLPALVCLKLISYPGRRVFDHRFRCHDCCDSVQRRGGRYQRRRRVMSLQKSTTAQTVGSAPFLASASPYLPTWPLLAATEPQIGRLRSMKVGTKYLEASLHRQIFALLSRFGTSAQSASLRAPWQSLPRDIRNSSVCRRCSPYKPACRNAHVRRG